MGVRGRVAVVCATATVLALAACGPQRPVSITPIGTCLPAVDLDGVHYIPGDPETNVRQGEPVEGVTQTGCAEGSTDPRPVQAWRAVGYRGDGLITVSACASVAPQDASAAGCAGDPPKFDLWVREDEASS